MDLYKLVLATLVGFALVNYVVIPETKRRWEASLSLAKVGKAGLVGALNFTRTFLLIATITLLILLLTVFLLGLGNAPTTAGVRPVITKIQVYRDNISLVQKYFAGWISLSLLVVLGILSYRREKRYIKEQLERKIEEEKMRLQRDAEEGKLEDLPPSNDMRQILSEIQRAQAKYEALAANSFANSNAKAERESLREYIKTLRGLWHAIDMDRRMNVTWDFDGVSAQRQPRLRSKLGTFFTSTGFVASMRTASRSLTNAGTVLLILSLIGINASALDATLKAQQISWKDLEIESNQQRVRDSFDKLMANNPPEKDEKPENKEDDKTQKTNNNILNHLARNFERSLSRSDVWRNPQSPENFDPASRRSNVKQQILAEVRNSTSEADGGKNTDTNGPAVGGNNDANPGDVDQDPRGGSGKPKQPGPRPSGGGGSSNAVSDEPTKSTIVSSVPEPQTSVGRQFRKDLEKTLARRKGLFEHIKAKFYSQLDQFSQPAEITDVSSYAFSEMIGSLTDAATGSSGTELEKLISKIAKANFKDSGKELYQLLFERMVTDFAGDTDMRDAFQRVRALEMTDIPILKSSDIARLREGAAGITRSPEYAKHLQEHPATLADNPNDIAELKEVAAKFRSVYKPEDPNHNKLLDAFASYDDIYKGQKGIGKVTVRETLLAELQTKLSKEIANDISQADFDQSRSYSELVGHPKTGGVLIGRNPGDADKVADFTGFNWTFTDDGVLLILSRADGRQFQLGPYDPSLVHQALAYVADGRKDAVTILNVDYKHHQKIFLHPAFVDTELGRDIIALDQFIFEVMEHEPGFIEADRRIFAQQALYETSWLDRVLALYEERLAAIRSALKQASEDDQASKAFPSFPNPAGRPRYDVDKLLNAKSDLEKELNSIRRNLGSITSDQRAAQALKSPDDLKDARRSILARKGEFFDSTLVERMSECARASRSGSLKSFNDCMRLSLGSEISSANDDTLRKWFVPPPRIESLSGVREKQFNITPDLGFLLPESGDDPFAQLSPLEYTILRAFSSKPQFLASGDAKTYFDLNPWEFDELKTDIAGKVWKKIDSDALLKSAYQELRKFIFLQRLFRIPLETNLWGHFPVERLIALTEATADSFKYLPTRRWENHSQGTLKPDLFSR